MSPMRPGYDHTVPSGYSDPTNGFWRPTTFRRQPGEGGALTSEAREGAEPMLISGLLDALPSQALVTCWQDWQPDPWLSASAAL